MSMQTSADSACRPIMGVCFSKIMPTSANRTNLFEDNTADEFVTGTTIGLFNYADGEVADGGLLMQVEFKDYWFRR